MNWGRMAVNMSTPLGLVAPTKKPSRTVRRSGLGSAATDGVNADASDLRWRMLRAPRYTR